MGYQIGIYIYGFLMKLAALFNEKAALFVKGRKGLLEKLKTDFDSKDKNVAWFHCASLGEFEQGRPVIEKFRRESPEHLVLLTFFSPSGYEIRKNYDGVDYVCYLPLDTPANVRKFIQLVNPSIAFFVKYEFWPNYLKILHERQVPVISFSTIFRKEQAFFKWYGGPYRGVLKFFDHFFIQNQSSASLLDELNLKNYTLSGDTRFDRVAAIASNPKPLLDIAAFRGSSKCMVIGSSWKEDMEVLLPLINDPSNTMKYIIVPHEIEEKAILKLQESIEADSGRYSQWTEDMADSQVLIIDSIGLLSSIYQFADIAYIGGAFGKGLHNTLEAVIYEIPVLFGNKKYSKFQEANDLIAAGAAWPVGSSRELKEKISAYLGNPGLKEKTQKAIRDYIEANLGATDQIINYSKNLLS